jgi:hypothetical protein
MAPARRPLISNSGEAAYCERLGLGRPSKTMQSPVAARHRGNVALAETLLVQGAQAVPQLLFRNSRSGRDERRMLVVQPHAHLAVGALRNLAIAAAMSGRRERSRRALSAALPAAAMPTARHRSSAFLDVLFLPLLSAIARNVNFSDRSLSPYR